MLKHLLNKAREFLAQLQELFSRHRDVHYTSVPVWKPWRDF